MNDAALQSMPPALQSEFDAMRDQRDLYRSLLLSEPEPLTVFIGQALDTVESLRAALRMPTRDSAAFRGKIDKLQMELLALDQALIGLELPTITARLHNAAAAVNDIGLRAEITGNDLLPAMVLLEELCNHMLSAADIAAVHLPPAEEEEEVNEELGVSERRAQRQLVTALKQISDKLSAEHGKNLSLVTIGLEDIPESWGSALFDLLGQLIRNTIEHGIEVPHQRAALGKSETGTMAIEFVNRGTEGYELNVQDDGGGLDANRLATAGVKLGLISAETARALEPVRMINLIFQPGVTTAHDPARRGMGMQIVREHVQRLGGKMQIASKRGQYVRFQIILPSLERPS
jgi:signal transduction histidine kinase